MQLRSIHLRNYRKYGNQIIDLPPGIIGVVGRNGSGKSTLIEAIGWCLYGSNAARTSSEEIRTAGTAGGDCSVTLEFVLGSDAVRVVRELKGKNASVRASVFLNGSASAHVRGSKDVSDYIARRTGMDRVAFFASVFAQQKELNAFSELRPGERKKTIMRLLRIDRIDEALSAVREDVRRGGERIRMLKENLKDMDELRAEQERTKREKRRAEGQSVRHDRAVEEAAAAKRNARENLSAHEKKYKRHNKIDKRIAGIAERIKSGEKEKGTIEGDQRRARTSEGQLRDMQPQLDEYEIVKRQKEDLDGAQSQFKLREELERNHASLASKIDKAIRSNERHKERLARMSDLDAKRERQEADLSRRRDSIESLTGLVSGASAKIKEDRKKRREYGANLAEMKKQGPDGACPTCKRPLRDHLSGVTKRIAGEISGLEGEIHAGLDEKKRLESRLQSAKGAEERARKMLGKTVDQVSKRASLQERLEEGEKSLASLEGEAQKLEERIDGLPVLEYDPALHKSVARKYARLQLVKERSMKLSGVVEQIPVLEKRHARCVGDIAELEEKRAAEEEKLGKVGYDRAEHDRAGRASEKAAAKLADARVKSAELKAEVGEMERQLAQIEDDIAEEAGRQKRIEEEEELARSRSKLEQVMGSFRSDLMSRIRPMLSQRASEMLGRITRGRYALVDLDDDYNILVEDNGESFTTDRFSGGEEDLANLCLRIAISQELAERSGWEQISFIALDEIFGSQDGGRKRDILDALQTLSGQFRQILVITHIEDVKEALPYVLNVREGAGGMSSITVEGAAPVAARGGARNG